MPLYDANTTRQVHAIRILVMTIRDIVDSGVENACYATNGTGPFLVQ